MSYCVVRCWCCTTPCTTLYDASYIPDASGPDALYDTVRRVVRSRRVGPRRLVRRPDASYNAFPTALAQGHWGTQLLKTLWGGGVQQGCIGRGGRTPPSRAPSQRPANASLTSSTSFNGICN